MNLTPSERVVQSFIQYAKPLDNGNGIVSKPKVLPIADIMRLTTVAESGLSAVEVEAALNQSRYVHRLKHGYTSLLP